MEEDLNRAACLKMILNNQNFQDCVNLVYEWLTVILKKIELEELGKGKLRALYSILILQELENYFEVEKYTEIDF
jgi:hypothetical protein